MATDNTSSSNPTDETIVDGAIAPDTSAETTDAAEKGKRGAPAKVEYEIPNGGPIPSWPFPEEWPIIGATHKRIEDSDFAKRKDYLAYAIWYCETYLARRIAAVKETASYQKYSHRLEKLNGSLEMIDAMGIAEDDAAAQDAAGSAAAAMEALLAAGLDVSVFMGQFNALREQKEKDAS